jgi:hypothetical protein
MSHHWINSDRDLFSFMKYVLLYAPDQFPREDYLKPDEQMTLGRAFDELRRGLQFLPHQQLNDKVLMSRLRGMLEAAYERYTCGDAAGGGGLLKEIDQLTFRDIWSGIEQADRASMSAVRRPDHR